MTQNFETIDHNVDFCVVGGGMAGLVAAIAAARRGAKTVLMHERPVLGGNSSSECRVHVCGADTHNSKKHLRETGILEEIRLENLRRNPNRNFSIWDTLLYEKAKAEPNLTLLLNCSANSAVMAGARIASVTGWQLTTQCHHRVTAKIFADCSGDGVLAPITGAEFRVGREARSEFNEAMAPEVADRKTMGMTCCFQARRHDTQQYFTPPAWAHRFDKCEDIPYGTNDWGHRRWFEMGYWWVEMGGSHDSIRDTEMLRDELLKITYGVWDHIKNRCPHTRIEAANWAIDWIQFLPAKRESRRYVGDHLLNECDIETEGRFDDRVAYGGWSMDDHHPEGFWAVKSAKPATMFHKTPELYGIPYRSLYSRNIENLMFAGRDASCTHMAMSSTRVMGTGSSQGQAVGTAAALAAASGVTPRDIGKNIAELQQALLADDAYIPWVKRDVPPLTTAAKITASHGDAEPLRDGFNRQVGSDSHCWPARPGDSVTYSFDRPQRLRRVQLVLDSGMDLNIQLSYHQFDHQRTSPPPVTPRYFRVEALAGGQWREVFRTSENHQRLINLPLDGEFDAIRFTLEQTWGAPESRVYAMYVE